VGLDLERHAAGGISVEKFMKKIESSGALSNKHVTWITYQGFADLGYFLLGLERSSRLPDERRSFVSWVQRIFPNLYDLKKLHKMGYFTIPSMPGQANLGAFAEDMAVQRRGESHMAGSDFLLNLDCYQREMLLEQPYSPMIRFRGYLYVVCGSIPEDPAGIDMLVRRITLDRFNMDGRVPQLYMLFPLFSTVSVEITFGSSLRTESYAVA
jgi:hypothetical protein